MYIAVGNDTAHDTPSQCGPPARRLPNRPTLMDAVWYAVIGVLAIDVALVVLYTTISKYQVRKTIHSIWNEPVELKDVDGQVIKVPVRYQKEDGSVDTKHIIAPLWMTVAYGLGSFSAGQIKMAIMGEKGRLSQRMSGELLKKVQAGEAPAEMLAEFLPKKWQKYIAGYEALRAVLGGQAGAGDLTIQPSGRRGGGPI